MSDFTFSEHGEDILIHRLLLWKKNGFYLDCGAYHALKMSMTARLRNFGWTGINVDIDPQVVSALEKDIPASKSICRGIGPEGGVATFYQFEDPVLNTISESQFQHLQEIANRGELFTKLVSKSTVYTTSIESILKNFNVAPYSLNFLNLDVEGVELKALKGFPWDSQKPEVIAVEIHGLDLPRCSENCVVAYLYSRGYVLQSYVFHTAIFCHLEFDTELCHRVGFSSL